MNDELHPGSGFMPRPGPSEREHVGRRAALVSAGTGLSRLLGFIRDMLIAHFLGAGVMADIFLAVLRLPNILRRLLTEGAVAIVEADECDRLGMHQADLQGLRRAVGRLDVAPNFVLTDGFAVDGLGVPGLAVWKGDKVAACVSAASIVAKVTRDRIMVAHDATYPSYGFAIHKGYCTSLHQAALDEHGPSEIHRWCFDNVARTARVLGP